LAICLDIDHELPDGGMSFGNMRLATEDTGRKFPFNDRAVSRLDNIDQAGVIGKISKHIANRVVKVHNTKILTVSSVESLILPKLIPPSGNSWSFNGSNETISPTRNA
jgi:hypothetical protein